MATIIFDSPLFAAYVLPLQNVYTKKMLPIFENDQIRLLISNK